MSEKKASKKPIESDEEEFVNRKKNKKDKLNEAEQVGKKHKKSKKEKEKKDKEFSKDVEKSDKNDKKIEEKEKFDEDNRKTIESEVHTANNWEEADLGNDQRKLKFLKLMGAFKHKSEKDVPHKHSRGKNETQKIAEDLEKQFNEGLSHKFQKNHHMGLGFHDSDQTIKKIPENKHIVFDD